MFRTRLILLMSLLSAGSSFADRRTDEARLGEYYSSIPLYRSGSGTNVLSVGLGTPAQNVNLTLTTNVAFLAVAGDQCDRCLDNADQYWDTDSSSFTGSQDAVSYLSIYPFGTKDTLLLTGQFGQDRITDARSDEGNSRPIAVIDTLRQDSVGGLGGTETSLSRGSSGFWGLGILDARPGNSILPSMLSLTNDGRPSDATYYTVGFDIGPYSNVRGAQTGTIHWGGVPSDAYQGNFAWLDANTTVAAGWGLSIDRMRVGTTVVDANTYYASLDPGFDAIYLPGSLAERLHNSVSEAERDASDTTRWNLPCGANISMTVTLGGHEYRVASSELVRPRDTAGRTCWSSIVAWESGSLPEELGEIRLGTPFLSGVYSALYYSAGSRYIGIAGKAGTVNALDVSEGENRGPNKKLAGILIGSLLAVLLIGLVLCYARNRNTWQSMWYRAVRRQHRVQTNAMVRAATLPPPMMFPPTAHLMGPPMGPMGPMGPIGPAGPMGPWPRPMMPGQMGMMWPPPAYQHPIQHQQHQQHPQHQQQLGPAQARMPPHAQQLPPVVEHRPQGFYSPRQQDQGMAAPEGGRAAASNSGGQNQRSQMDSYQGMPHPSSGREQRSSHQESPHRVKWGSVAAKHRSIPDSSSSDPARRVPKRVTEAHDSKTPRHDAWLRGYSGAGQSQQPYPELKPPRMETRLSASAPAAPGFEAQAPIYMNEKKRPWSWAKKSKEGSKGEYSPVGYAIPPDMAAQRCESSEKGEKRRSWFGGRFDIGIAAGEGARMKREERNKEREALARGDSGVVYGV